MPVQRINAGDLRHPVAVTAPVRVSDGAGGWTTTQAVVANTRARITPLRGRELVDYQQIDSRVTVSMQLRYDPDVRVTTQHQIQYLDSYGHTHNYLIHFVRVVDERDRVVELMCEERHAK